MWSCYYKILTMKIIICGNIHGTYANMINYVLINKKSEIKTEIRISIWSINA